MSYANIEDVKKRTEMDFNEEICESLLEDASLLIDSYGSDVDDDIKRMVCCRMVIRALPNDYDMPIGASQGTTSGLGYSQTWTLGQGGSVGQIYITRDEKRMLKCGSRIGSHSPIEDVC